MRFLGFYACFITILLSRDYSSSTQIEQKQRCGSDAIRRGHAIGRRRGHKLVMQSGALRRPLDLSVDDDPALRQIPYRFSGHLIFEEKVTRGRVFVPEKSQLCQLDPAHSVRKRATREPISSQCTITPGDLVNPESADFGRGSGFVSFCPALSTNSSAARSPPPYGCTTDVIRTTTKTKSMVKSICRPRSIEFPSTPKDLPHRR